MHGFEKVIQFRETSLNHQRPFTWTINPKQLNIHWVIPNFTPGLGGHTTIFAQSITWNVVVTTAPSGFIPSSKVTSETDQASCINASSISFRQTEN